MNQYPSSERFQILPQYWWNGIATFQGQPCPTKKVVEKIGIDGVEYLDKKIKQIIQDRLDLFGNVEDNLYGVFNDVKFLDKQEENVLFISEFQRYTDERYTAGEFHYNYDDEFPFPGNKPKRCYDPIKFKLGNYYIGYVDFEELGRLYRNSDKDIFEYVRQLKHSVRSFLDLDDDPYTSASL